MKIKNISMTTMIMIAMVLGIVSGIVVGPAIGNIRAIGDIFLRLIQMTVVILVMGAVIEAVGQIAPKDLGKLGGKIFSLFMISTVISAIIGIILAEIIQPGAGIDVKLTSATDIVAPQQTIYEMVVNFFPKNIIEAMTAGNMIQCIVFSLLFGMALSLYSHNTNDKRILDSIKTFNIIILGVVKLVMKMAPLGIFALLAWVTGTIGLQVMVPLMKFLICMAVGTVIILFLFITLTAMYAKVSPLKLAGKVWRMGVVAFTTTSSAISLPVKMEDSEQKIGVSKRISQLVNPLGMALNSNGLSLFLAISCITLAQFYHLEMSLVFLIQIIVLSTLATLGTVVVPGGGLVALAIVLPSMGLPLESIALLAGIDWFSGMFRTVLNVVDDALIALIIAVGEDEFDRDIFDGKSADIALNSGN
ncbi:dicarboxylate/amino acid:cation symporter [Budvicia aquatica]|uniref:Dicarboxylate/amino acid:cation symporter n=3 Tax=Budvicia aquatica TaxID=82979 RepID=A0A2C6CUS7_9GAMM|nr:dicarboxylate/amino acid:cation symporter [Budvicia aquatica]